MQLTLFPEKEGFTIKRPTITPSQKSLLVRKWAEIAYDNDYTDLDVDSDFDELYKIFDIFDFAKSNYKLSIHLEYYLTVPDEYDDDDELIQNDDYSKWEDFLNDISYDVDNQIMKNVKRWVKIHNLMLIYNEGDIINGKKIINRDDDTYQYICKEDGKFGIIYLNGEDVHPELFLIDIEK